MPYIKQENRNFIDENVGVLSGYIENVGELNYAITRLAMKFLLVKGLNYENINAVSGVLQKVLAEFDARVARPYEDLKIQENGDVPEYAEANAIVRDKWYKAGLGSRIIP